MNNKIVAYFSVSGITKNAAQQLSVAAGADLFEIKPEAPYTKEDLNWQDKTSRNCVEVNNPNSRPGIKEKIDDMENYDVVFLGFPIWWMREPRIIDTFLEQYDFSGKTIVPFATSGSSGFGDTSQLLKKYVSPEADVREGKMLNGDLSRQELTAWVESLNLK